MRSKTSTLAMLSIVAVFLGAGLATAGELDGRWRNGSWVDNNSGHTGPLRGRFRETPGGDYRVVFSGRFRKVIPFVFPTTLKVVGRDGDKVIMAGESRVGLFGRFTYSAVADGNHFDAQYSSRRWAGEFHLTR
ncbi:MAG: hypothetical protein HYX68_19235 [Planctomycetes bacterium]|nr:hypothetical protein [Planctomycetota bacterium]